MDMMDTSCGDVCGRNEDDDVDAKKFRNSTQHLRGFLNKETGGDELFVSLTSKDDSSYDLSTGRRLAIVFNHEQFPPSKGLPRRNGTESDCQAIKDVFGELNFEVRIYDDSKQADIEKVIMDLNKEKDLSILALFILTHGEENGILHSNDSTYRLDKNIIDHLLPNACPNLATRPKLVFIQACQGKATDDGAGIVTRRRHTSTDGSLSAHATCNYKIPHYADLLVFLAAYHGHYSFRSRAGSWFIQALCCAISQSAEEDEIHSVLTLVKRSVALGKISNVPTHPELHGKVQIPLVQDTLIRDLYIKKHVIRRDSESNLTHSPVLSVQEAMTELAVKADQSPVGNSEEKYNQKKGRYLKSKCKQM